MEESGSGRLQRVDEQFRGMRDKSKNDTPEEVHGRRTHLRAPGRGDRDAKDARKTQMQRTKVEEQLERARGDGEN